MNAMRERESEKIRLGVRYDGGHRSI